MASQNLNVGTAANANDGDTLRAAFIKVRKMFAEVYGQTYVDDTTEIPSVTFEIKEDKLKATNDAVDGYVLTYDSGTGGFTWEQKYDGDITSIVAGAGLTGSSLETDDATLNVIGGDGITVNADEVEATVDGTTIELSATDGTGALRVKDDGITHDKLENRYTARVTSSSTGSQNLNCANASSFELTGNIAASTILTLQNMKIGQSVDILFTGTLTSATGLTLDTNFTTDTIYRVGDGEFDTSTGNIIQVTCLNDSDSAAKIAYSVAQFTVDATP